MAPMRFSPCLLLALVSIWLLVCSTHAVDRERRVYIVYMGDNDSENYSSESLHLNLLDQVLESSSAEECLVYSYKRSFNGFAAKLTDKEQEKLAGMEGIVSVFPSQTLKLHTTRSWDFLGFPETAKRKPALESDVIVGVIDTGIWPESESFKDHGFGPPPDRWKGTCKNFTCNNKIIGARYYRSSKPTDGEELSPRDFVGHGSHTASTAAGGLVRNSSLHELAQGTARGAVPSARIAVYKACWKDKCEEHFMLAAFDDAIADGVDILSVSIGADTPRNYSSNSLAIGSFHAMKKGILTSASAGNNGPDRGTVSNIAPWMLVVAGGSTHRRMLGKLVLGNNMTIVGNSINVFPTEQMFYPFVSALISDDSTQITRVSNSDSLDEIEARDKIILCDNMLAAREYIAQGAKGAVVVSAREFAVQASFPVIFVSRSDAEMLQNYINTTGNPVANIHKSEEVFEPRAPVVASFSSRGPNKITPDILKPDITAPGVYILAAWSPEAAASFISKDTRSINYNIISGTSMACPHVTGVAAYVKSFHPSWSPAAIMSALMTTASPMNAYYNPEAELAYGAGQVNPTKARSPGLVYDAAISDYVKMLCDQGYSMEKINLITGENSSCPHDAKGTARDLNYPSMAAYVHQGRNFNVQFPRTVTNVGSPNTTYTARINSGSKLNVTVSPKVLTFMKLDEKQNFAVTVSGEPLNPSSIASASIVWSNGKNHVRSPIVVYTDFS